LTEQINYNLLFLWYVVFSIDTDVWNHFIFTKNRNRLLEGEVAHCFFLPRCYHRPIVPDYYRRSISA